MSEGNRTTLDADLESQVMSWLGREAHAMTRRHCHPSARAASISARHSRSFAATASPGPQLDTMTLVNVTSRQFQPSGPELMDQLLTSSSRRSVTSMNTEGWLESGAVRPSLRGARRRSRCGRAYGSACSRAVTSPQSSHLNESTATLDDSHDGHARHSGTAASSQFAYRFWYRTRMNNWSQGASPQAITLL